MFEKYKAHFVLGVLIVLAIVSFAIAGTISQHPYGVSTPYWYGYSSGAPASYYLAAPTLSSNDTAVGLAATQTLTNKTLTSPTITGPTMSGTVTGGTYASSTINAPVIDLTVTAKTADYTALTTDAGQILTNNGATTEITFLLPEASTVVGKRFHFVVVSAYSVHVDVDDADQIVPDTDSAGDKITAPGTKGQMVGLLALDNTNYVHILGTQSWIDGD